MFDVPLTRFNIQRWMRDIEFVIEFRMHPVFFPTKKNVVFAAHMLNRRKLLRDLPSDP